MENVELTDETAEAIAATWPVCPQCKLNPSLVQYTYHATHNLYLSLDASPSLADDKRTMIYDSPYDVLDKEPVATYQVVNGVQTLLGYVVECENGHSWTEPRIRPTGKDSWELLPETVTTQIALLDGLLGRETV